MFLLQMEIDLEEHKTNWALGQYKDMDGTYQGQANYIMDLRHVVTDFINMIEAEEEENEDDES